MKHNIGDEIRLEVVVKIKGKDIRESEGKKRKGIDMDIMKLQVLGKAGKVSEEEYDNMSDEDKESYDKESVGLK